MKKIKILIYKGKNIKGNDVEGQLLLQNSRQFIVPIELDYLTLGYNLTYKHNDYAVKSDTIEFVREQEVEIEC